MKLMWPRDWEPYFFEHSQVPVWLSWFAPIKINAITLFCFVFSRKRMSPNTRTHETIHFQQYLETLVIGFILIYLFEFVIRFIVYRGDGSKAYRKLSFEQEAYRHDIDKDYLQKRKRFAWVIFLTRF